jgi:ATP-dependent RNA helicase DeaD
MNPDTSSSPAGDAVSFSDLGLHPDLLTALSDLGYEEPTPIQAEAIPVVIKGSDVLGQAATGTGKTAAFALPVLDRLAQSGRSKGQNPMALVLVPTRELAIQVSEAMHKYGKRMGARVLPIYGGQPIGRQLSQLERGVDIVVATPGRAVDCINRRKLVLEDIEIAVLDEADEMLDMGFAEELETILGATSQSRQTVLFSATMPRHVETIARRHMTDPERIQIERAVVPEGEQPRIRQMAYIVGRNHKAAALGRILDVESPSATIVFCRTRAEVETLTETLNARGYRAEALHGGMDQMQRDRVMGRIRKELAELLIATDVAARGLDIDHLTHVVNFDVPSAPESYTHRIGRVGRAGREGVAITLVDPREHRMLKTIERVTKFKIDVAKLPSVEDLRSRRLQSTKDVLVDALESDDNNTDQFRAVVEALSDEHDIMEIALAAVKLAHERGSGSDKEEHIPELSVDVRDGKGRPQRGGYERGGYDRGGKSGGYERKSGGYERGGDRGGNGKGPRRGSGGDMTRLFVGAGKESGVRPQDLVGAIANQSSVPGNQIGDIQIRDNFSLVEVPAGSANEVIDALRGTTIRGKKANVRRERF